jgi:methylthioribose-1-phosphate isomerase
MLGLSDTLTFTTIKYSEKRKSLKVLDQTKLPDKKTYLLLKTADDVYHAIKNMNVRGAPLIGVAAAYGVVLAAARSHIDEVIKAADRIRSARPTAVNLEWAVARMKKAIRHSKNIYKDCVKEAKSIEQEDKESCTRISIYGTSLIKKHSQVMVYCNAGALATSGIGTALGILYTAHHQKKHIHVYACETRPLLQGSRLTTWELMQQGIPTSVLCDNMAATYMPQMDCVLVGADRIARNGDTANKVGTYNLAIIAHRFKVPLYIAAPVSTIDFTMKTGMEIPIEIRNKTEVTHFNGKRTTAPGVDVCNPAFDVTPHRFISCIITNQGIIKHPYNKNLKKLTLSDRGLQS